MATDHVHLVVEAAVLPAAQEAIRALESIEGDLTLDCSSVDRIGPDALRALEELAVRADEKQVRVVLAGVSTGVYRVLKLVKLTSRFSFS